MNKSPLLFFSGSQGKTGVTEDLNFVYIEKHKHNNPNYPIHNYFLSFNGSVYRLIRGLIPDPNNPNKAAKDCNVFLAHNIQNKNEKIIIKINPTQPIFYTKNKTTYMTENVLNEIAELQTRGRLIAKGQPNLEGLVEEGKQRAPTGLDYLDHCNDLKQLKKQCYPASGRFKKNFQLTWIVQEFIEGKTLFEAVKEIQDFFNTAHIKTPSAAVEKLLLLVNFLEKSALDLRAMHERGSIHRDTHLRNFIVQPNQNVTAIDFGKAQKMCANVEKAEDDYRLFLTHLLAPKNTPSVEGMHFQLIPLLKKYEILQPYDKLSVQLNNICEEVPTGTYPRRLPKGMSEQDYINLLGELKERLEMTVAKLKTTPIKRNRLVM